MKAPNFDVGNPVWPIDGGMRTYHLTEEKKQNLTYYYVWRLTTYDDGRKEIHFTLLENIDRVLGDLWEPWNDDAPHIDENLWKLFSGD